MGCDQTLVTKVDKAIKDEFTKMAKELELTPSALLRNLVHDFIENPSAIKEKANKKTAIKAKDTGKSDFSYIILGGLALLLLQELSKTSNE